MSLPTVDVIEISVNSCAQANLDVVLPMTREAQVGVIAKRPTANAAWKQTHPGTHSDDAKPYAQPL